MLQNLLFGLVRVKRNDDDLVVFRDERSATSTRLQGVKYADIPNRRFANRFAQEALVLPWYTRDLDALLLPNYFTPPFATSRRVVTVVHDLQYLHFPQYFSRRKRAWLRASHELTLRRADAVIAISEFVKGDILDRYGSKYADKVHVIPNPVSWPELEVEARDSLTDSPYILSVAAQYPHKNLITLVRAFASIRSQFPDHRLVLVGQLPDRLIGTVQEKQVSTSIERLGLTDSVIMTGFISDQELAKWYRNASLFVFPSLFEGFGLPPVEALGYGLPVLSTTCGSLREVTMGFSNSIDDPLNVKEYAEKMMVILKEPQKFAPSHAQVQHIRSHYASEMVASKYYSLLTGAVD